MTSLVSVIMPVYNNERYVSAALESVLAQSLQDFEVIAIDDASTDNSPAILAKKAGADSRIRVIRRSKNSGKPGIVRNLGLTLSQGQYIAFLDGDDLYHPNRLERCVTIMDRVRWAGLLFHDALDMDQNGTPMPISRHQRGIGETIGAFTPPGEQLDVNDEHLRLVDPQEFLALMLAQNVPMLPVTVMLRRSAIDLPADHVGLFGGLAFPEDVVVWEDADLFIRMTLTWPVCYSNAVLSYYRRYPTSLTRRISQIDYASDVLQVRCRNYLLASPALNNLQHAMIRHRIARDLMNLGYLYSIAGMPSDAVSHYRFSLHWVKSARWILNVCKWTVKAYLRALLGRPRRLGHS